MSRCYIGVKPCGCVTAAMVDDEKTTADDVASFAKKMKRTNRRVENVTGSEMQRRFNIACDHEPVRRAASTRGVK